MRLSGPILGFSGLALGVMALGVASSLANCTIYDTSLLTPSGSGGGASTDSTSSSPDTTSTGATTTCTSPTQCPGMDTECGTRTCVDGVCGIDPMPNGTVLAGQQAGDCKRNVCDGAGDATIEPDATDVPTDGKECTDDACNGDQPSFTDKADGLGCTEGGGAYCKAGACVECVDPGDCASGICTMQNTCAPATCDDTMLNGTESDTDCGGSCDKCVNGLKCNGPDDCISSACSGGHCQPSCTDLEQDQDESDTDCGGSTCAPCAIGLSCDVPSDCATGVCNASSQCGEYQILVSEVRTRGPMGGNDDFVELYNPLSVDVVLPNDITVSSRSDGAGSYTVRWTSSGQLFPAHHHLLLGGSSYGDAVSSDASLTTGITDKASVTIEHGLNVIDAVCFYCGTNPFGGTYACEGTPVNKPSCSSTTNYTSVDRKPGGAAGNGTDTGDNTADFVIAPTSNPEDLASGAEP